MEERLLNAARDGDCGAMAQLVSSGHLLVYNMKDFLFLHLFF